MGIEGNLMEFRDRNATETREECSSKCESLSVFSPFLISTVQRDYDCHYSIMLQTSFFIL